MCPVTPTESLPAVLTVKQVAEALAVTTSTVYRWAKDGTLPSVKVGETVRFRRDEIERLFESAS